MWLVLAERLVVTSTMTFSIGSIDAGPHDGFAAPGGHFDLGVTFKKLRLAAEFDASLWSNEDAPDDLPESGSFTRFGGSLRYYFMDLDVGGGKGTSLLRLYVEGGAGRHAIDAPSVELTRPDVSFGFGMQQQAQLGGVTLGGTFGIRVLLAEAPAPSLACRGSCEPYRRHDIAMFFTMGFAVGK
jgi:hypothetical protein